MYIDIETNDQLKNDILTELRSKDSEQISNMEMNMLTINEAVEKLQKDITSLMENLREIQNSNDIAECIKNTQIRFISKLISKARAKIDFFWKICKSVTKNYVI